MTISIIAALAKNSVIGKDNNLPWDMPADLQHFRKMTEGKPVIMGQKTFESIGKPLPGRLNIVLSRDESFQPEGCRVAGSIKEALEKAKDSEEVMVAGGASVYEQFLPLADRMYLTLIQKEFEGDAFFPEWKSEEWEETDRLENEADDKNPYPYTFITLKRKK